MKRIEIHAAKVDPSQDIVQPLENVQSECEFNKNYVEAGLIDHNARWEAKRVQWKLRIEPASIFEVERSGAWESVGNKRFFILYCI